MGGNQLGGKQLGGFHLVAIATGLGGFQMGGKRWVDFDQVECGYWQVDFGLERKWQSENDQSENGGAI